MKRAMLVVIAFCLIAADLEGGPPAQTDKNLLQGKWKVIASEFEGKKSKLTKEELQSVKLAVTGDRFVMEFPPGDVFGSAVRIGESLGAGACVRPAGVQDDGVEPPVVHCLPRPHDRRAVPTRARKTPQHSRYRLSAKPSAQS